MKSVEPNTIMTSDSFLGLIDKVSKRRDLQPIFESEVKEYCVRKSLSAKRRPIWDYFFYSHYDNVGTEDEMLAAELSGAVEGHIERITIPDFARRSDEVIQKYDRQIGILHESIYKLKKQWLILSGSMLFLYLIIELAVNSQRRGGTYNPAFLILFGICIAAFAAFQYKKYSICMNEVEGAHRSKKAETDSLHDEREKAISDIRRKCTSAIKCLRGNILNLRKMIPPRPGDSEILAVLEEDAETIRKTGMERMSMTIMGEPVDEIQASEKLQPFCEPALLQQDAPEGLKNLYPSHIGAMRRTGSGEDVYAVNFYKFIIPSQHQINIYSTFYNHIIGAMYGEFTDSFFIRDVVSFSTSTQARELAVRGESFLVTNAMLISIVLTSGDKISFNIRNRDFISTVLEVDKRLEMKRLTLLKDELKNELASLPEDEENRALINEVKSRLGQTELALEELLGKHNRPVDADRTLEGIIRFLRKQLKDHKS